jgi:hypothetical protein
MLSGAFVVAGQETIRPPVRSAPFEQRTYRRTSFQMGARWQMPAAVWFF